MARGGYDAWPVPPARFVTWASLRWIVRHRAWTPWYLLRYARLLRLRLTHPEIRLTGMVFLGRGVRIGGRRGYGRIVLGRWVHVGDGTQIRCHEGTLRIGDKVVFGQHDTVNAYLDISIGDAVLIADWVYICDFDHLTADITLPIKDQGIVKSPVRIGPDVWIGVKATVLRGARIGRGAVVAAHAVVRGTVEEFTVVGGVPARVLKDRRVAYAAGARKRRSVAAIGARARKAVEGLTDR